jgi:hypothetical protein
VKKSKFNTNRYLPLISALFIAIIFTFVSSAHATLQIRLTQGGSPQVVVIDQGALDTDPGTLGSASWSGNVGVFSVSVTTGTSKPMMGSASKPQMSLVSIETTSSQQGTLSVEVTDTDFGPLDAYVVGFDTLVNGTRIGNQVQFDAYDDTTNAPYGPGANIASGTWNGSGMISWGSPYYTSVVPTSSPFSLTMKADITHTAGGSQTTQFDATIESRVVPEPGTILLLGLGLLGLGIIGKKKSEKA